MSQLNKIYFKILIIIAIFLALCVFAIPEIMNVMKASSDEYLKAKEEAFFGKIEIDSLQKNKLLVEKIEKDFLNIEHAFLNEEELVNFIYLLEEKAKKNNTLIHIKSIQLPENKNSYITFNVSLDSDFNGLMRFLKSMEGDYEHFRLIQIRNLSIQSAQKSASEGGEEPAERNLFSEIEIRAYSISE